MTDQEVLEWAEWCSQAASVVEHHFGAKLCRNKSGCPTLFWLASTETRDILEMAARAWARAITECDDTAKIRECSAPANCQPGGFWKIIIVWMLHVARFGNKDALSGLELDCRGDYHNLHWPIIMLSFGGCRRRQFMDSPHRGLAEA